MNFIVTPNGYLVWNRTTGDIDSINYEDVKALLRHINVLPAVSIESEKIEQLIHNTAGNPTGDTDTILGYHKDKFTENQLKQIESYIIQLKKKTK